MARAFCRVKTIESDDIEVKYIKRLKLVASLSLRTMKGGSSYKPRVTRFPLALIALLCLSIVVWVWEKTPLLTTFLPPLDQFDMDSNTVSPGLSVTLFHIAFYTLQFLPPYYFLFFSFTALFFLFLFF